MTKHRVLITTTLAVIVSGALVFSGNGFSKSSPAQKTLYSTHLKDVRTIFNADKAKVRLLMLLSPT